MKSSCVISHVALHRGTVACVGVCWVRVFLMSVVQRRVLVSFPMLLCIVVLSHV